MEELGAEGGRRRGEGEGEIVSSSPEQNGSGGFWGGSERRFFYLLFPFRLKINGIKKCG